MPQQASHSHPSYDADLQVPTSISARQRLEWEVSQLADGTLAPDRRAAVEAALVSDAELREMYRAHRRVSELLVESGAMHFEMSAVQEGIMAAIAAQPQYGAPLSSERQGRGESAPVADVLRGWWLTISAAAAALVIGVGLGVVMFAPQGDSVVSVAVGDPNGGESGGAADIEPQIEVTGPLSIAQESGQTSDVVALTVTGPDFHAILDPQIETPLPDYAYSYGTAAVIDTPREMLIASVSQME